MFFILLALSIALVVPISSSSPFEGKWGVVSKALWSFGDLTVTSSRLKWSSGKVSSYKVVSATKAEFLLKLTSKKLPRFDGITCPFLKLKVDGNDLEVSFYKGFPDSKDSNLAMWGVYTHSNN